jgi:hypothetical protein
LISMILPTFRLSWLDVDIRLPETLTKTFPDTNYGPRTVV